MVALRHILAIVLLPAMVTIVVPRWILVASATRESRLPRDDWSWIPRTLGGLLVLAGLALLTWCISLFVRVGKGTLAPWDPTGDQRRRLNTRTPRATSPIPNHSRKTGRSPRNTNANRATSTTLNLSTGATFAASPILSARK